MKNKEVEFVKQTPMHPRGRLKRSSKNKLIHNENETEIESVKQIPMHPRDRLKRNTRKISINDDVKYIGQFQSNPRNIKKKIS